MSPAQPTRAPTRPHLSRRMEACTAALLDELQLARAWSRPSLLFAVQRSPIDQPRAMQALQARLAEHAIPAAIITPDKTQPNLLLELAHRPDAAACVFLVHRLGTQTWLYDGLNLHRERLVDARLKLTLWLTRDEATLLARRAPDFWAFRHRVIEFPTPRRTTDLFIPSGALCWHTEETSLEASASLASLPHTSDMRAENILALARSHWLAGDTLNARQMLETALEAVSHTSLRELHARLLNALAIMQYDQHEIPSALASIDAALQADESQGWLWANLGIIARAARQGRRSAAALKKALRAGADSPSVWEAVGFVQFARGEFKSALESFERALALTPSRAGAYAMLILCRQWLGDAVEPQLSKQPADVYRAGLRGKMNAMPGEWRRDPALYFIIHSQVPYDDEPNQQPALA